MHPEVPQFLVVVLASLLPCPEVRALLRTCVRAVCIHSFSNPLSSSFMLSVEEMTLFASLEA